MTIPLPSAMERATVTWTLGHADTTGPLDGARGRVRFEATAVAVAYSDRTVLPKPVETPIIAGVMTPVDLIVNDPDIWNWKVQVRVGVNWEPFHINVPAEGTNLASASITPGKGPVRVLKGDQGFQGASLASLEQVDDAILRAVIEDPATGDTEVQDYVLPRGPEGPYGGTVVTDPQVASMVAVGGTETRAALVARDREVRLNVADYGAIGGNYTADTAAVRAAVADAKQRGGAAIWFPPGRTYLLRDIDCSGLSNATFEGVRGASILQYHRSGAGSHESMFEFNGDSNPATNDRGITFRGLTLRGDGALSEHQALIFLSAVSDVLVDNVEFLNMQGDGVNIARTTVGGVDSGVHNYRVTVRDCLFDGIDRRGRNGISSMDIDGLTVAGSTFRRLAAPGMPGAIDLEPNVFDTTAVISNVDIYGNRFEDNGGNVGDVALAFVPTTGEAFFSNINVHDNTFVGTRARNAVHMEWHLRAAKESDPRQQVAVTRNTIYAPHVAPNVTQQYAAVEFRGITGFAVENNEIIGWKNRAVGGGATPTSAVRHGAVIRNRFIECGATTGYVVNFDYIDGLDVSDNTARSSTTLAAFVAFMSAYSVSGVKVTNNDLAGFSDALFSSAAASAAQVTPSTNVAYGNRGVPRQVAVASFATGKLVPRNITGAKDGNAALASLIAELARAGIITDSTSA